MRSLVRGKLGCRSRDTCLRLGQALRCDTRSGANSFAACTPEPPSKPPTQQQTTPVSRTSHPSHTLLRPTHTPFTASAPSLETHLAR